MDPKLLKTYRADQRPAMFMHQPMKLTARPTFWGWVGRRVQDLLAALAIFGLGYLAILSAYAFSG